MFYRSSVPPLAVLGALSAASGARALEPARRGAVARLAGPHGQGIARGPRCPWSGPRQNVALEGGDPGARTLVADRLGRPVFVTTAIEGELVPGSPRMKHPCRTAPTSATPTRWATIIGTPSR